MSKLLLISYYWPPAGGPGVQRSLKFVKYLVKAGWSVTVLTVKDGEFPALDVSLEKDVPKEVEICRVPAREPLGLYKRFTGQKKNESVPVAVLSSKKKGFRARFSAWVRMNLFIPDAKIFWVGPAVKRGRNILSEGVYDIVFSTSPPPSIHIVAKHLAKEFNLPWVADFRDPWTKIHYYSGKRSKYARKLDERLEQSVVQSADAITCVSQQFLELLPPAPGRSFIIPNGYDPDDLPPPMSPGKKFKVAYIGGLNANRFYPEILDKILSYLQQCDIDVEFFIAGSIDSDVLDYLKKKQDAYPGLIRMGKYLSHAEAIQEMSSSGLLILLLEKVASYSGHIPGKVFEYVSTTVPILAIGPEKGATSAILESCGAGSQLYPEEDPGPILTEAVELFKEGRRREINQEVLEAYSRKKLTGKLMAVFNKLIGQNA